MRNRIWYELADKKYESFYTKRLAKRATNLGNAYSFFLALTSAGSVAIWAIWNEYPNVWAAIVMISQVLHIAKPYLSFLKNDKDYIEMSVEFDALYLNWEKLWNDCEKAEPDEESIEKQYFEIKNKGQYTTDKFKGVFVPEFKSLVSVSSEETSKYLNRFS